MTQGPGSQEQVTFLDGCLVEGDSEFEKRARKIKRRALVASITVQILIVAALVLVPLLSKGENIAAYNPTIMPPYHRGTVPAEHQRDIHPRGDHRTICVTCVRLLRPVIADREPLPPTQTIDQIDPGPPGSPDGPVIPTLSANSDHRFPPPPPREIEKPHTIRVSCSVQEARLVRRVQPVYPALAITTRRQGRVELHAIIGTDGSIKSLEVISGDPLLIQSALAAVREWRYQPTLLNGSPVEVDTSITVIYTLNH